MKERIRFLTSYLLFWLVYFTIARVLFVGYHGAEATALDSGTLLGSMVHGFQMDLSTVGYLSIVPFLLVAISGYLPAQTVRRAVVGYSVGALLLVTLLTTIDLELFTWWGFRIDATPLTYIWTPRETLASAGSAPIGWLALIYLVLAALSVLAFLRLFRGWGTDFERGGPWITSVMVVFTAALIIPIRGGFQLAPLNQSTVYFSPDHFANQAALNASWNFGRSLVKRTSDENPYVYTDATTASATVDGLLQPAAAEPAPALLRTQTPNVIVLVWESFTAKVVERTGGVPGVTPEFDRLMREGILFDQVYATGDRTDKGLPAVLSGYPAQPTTSIIKAPVKTVSLPSLSKSFNEAGYRSTFFYGGELDFANFRSYLLNAEFDELVEKVDFRPEDWNSKWGAHDHVVLDYVLQRTRNASHPFFHTVLLLSSHEPFDVPIRDAIPGEEVEDLFLNSHYYTDQSVGAFIERAKQEPWWDNTVIVIVGDHGHRYPALDEHTPYKHHSEYHTPMLWLGGALATRDTVVSKVVSQIDLPKMLLNQLGLPSHDYVWSKDALSPSTPSLAYYAFNDGFGVVVSGGALTYDNVGRRMLHQEGVAGPREIKVGQAFVQLSFQDYLDRGRSAKTGTWSAWQRW